MREKTNNILIIIQSLYQRHLISKETKNELSKAWMNALKTNSLNSMQEAAFLYLKGNERETLLNALKE